MLKKFLILTFLSFTVLSCSKNVNNVKEVNENNGFKSVSQTEEKGVWTVWSTGVTVVSSWFIN